MFFLPMILKWLGGGVLTSVLTHLEKRADTETERERIRTQVTIEEVKAELARRNAQRDVLIAEQGNWITRWVRPMWALPFVVYTYKIVIWDKIWPGGVTDPLDERMWGLMMTVAGAYFIGRSAEKIATIVKRK